MAADGGDDEHDEHDSTQGDGNLSRGNVDNEFPRPQSDNATTQPTNGQPAVI
jgi:hypothetical protein